VIIEFTTVERLLEGVIKIFLQFDSEYWLTPVEYIPVYGIMQELDNYVDSKRNRCPLTHLEKEWIFDHRQAWEYEREIAAMEGRSPVRFIAKQPNVVRSVMIREPSVTSNSPSVSPPKRIIRKSTQEIERDKEVKRLSIQLNNLEVLKFQLMIKRLNIFLRKI
jgi:hypothetical protein